VNTALDSMTVIIVNRDMSSNRNVTVNLNGFSVPEGSYKTLQLSSLPSTETFKSDTDNALKTSFVTVNSNSFTVSVPPLSTTAILLAKDASESPITGIEENQSSVNVVNIYPNPASDKLLVGVNSQSHESVEIIVSDQRGRKIQSTRRYCDGITPITVDISTIPNGFYLLSVTGAGSKLNGKFVIAR
jgi:hypothetical protein